MTKEKPLDKKLHKETVNLVKDIYKFMAWLDNEMRSKSSHERGQRIATALNSLEYRLDWFSHFKLDLTFKKIHNMKKVEKND